MERKKIYRIIVAVDGSKCSLRAAQYALNLAGRLDARLIALSVVPLDMEYIISIQKAGLEIPALQDFVKDYTGKINRSLDGIRMAAEKKGINFAADVIGGPKSIVDSIINYANKEKADLIIVGTRGNSGLKRLFLGSISSGVIERADRPVIVVK
jgi:nucleotide-binding universal stress UspA family protein